MSELEGVAFSITSTSAQHNANVGEHCSSESSGDQNIEAVRLGDHAADSPPQLPVRPLPTPHPGDLCDSSAETHKS